MATATLSIRCPNQGRARHLAWALAFYSGRRGYHELPAGQKTEPLQLEIIESAHWKLNANRFGALRRSTLSWCRSSRAPPDMPEIENWGSSYETAPLAGD
jgi:hypothetical protein